MNACPVRTFDFIGGIELTVEQEALEPKNRWLPHEPRNGAVYAISLVKVLTDVALNKEVALNKPSLIGDYRECKHCGCLYREEAWA